MLAMLQAVALLLLEVAAAGLVVALFLLAL
jgi:hypothetical protein